MRKHYDPLGGLPGFDRLDKKIGYKREVEKQGWIKRRNRLTPKMRETRYDYVTRNANFGGIPGILFGVALCYAGWKVYRYFNPVKKSSSAEQGSKMGYSQEEAEKLSSYKLVNGMSLHDAATQVFDWIHFGAVIGGGLLALLDTQAKSDCVTFLKSNIPNPEVYQKLSTVYGWVSETHWLIGSDKPLTSDLRTFLSADQFESLYYLHLAT
jgi:hypothetical protein